LAGASSGQFFLNGADTETKGFDLIMTYSGIELFGGNLDITLAGNKTETEVTDTYTTGGLSAVDPDDVFGTQAISIIEEWQPEDRISLTGYYQLNNFQFNLAFNRFGEYTVYDSGSQDYDAVIVTDLSAKYTFGNGLGFTIGGNNVFDEYPDKNTIGNSRGGTLEDAPGGNIIVDSPGVFKYSRRSAPFGFNGAYWYAGVSYDF
jgi:iron complex outermembrane receptor protein